MQKPSWPERTMQFKLDFKIQQSDFRISHKDKITLLGSCFSDEMADKFTYSGFHCLSNPFGTLYHPIALSDVVRSSIDLSTEVDVLQRDGLYFSWDSASVIVGKSENELKSVLIDNRNKFREAIKDSSCLIFTFGTAFAYRQLELNKIVGNCHKIPASNFRKELTPIKEIYDSWLDLIALINKKYPGKRIILTVSPVRHLKDGVMENNRSKARLIESVHLLCDHFQNVEYFPSYEIIVDELRDYRFFKEDFSHPTSQATEYVWNRFQRTYFDEKTTDLIEEITSIRKIQSHKGIHPDSESDILRLLKVAEMHKELINRHPEINW